MSILIRDVREHELDSVLALNNAAGPGILPMDAARLRFFWENADYFRVAEEDGLLAGFLVAFAHDAPHDSSNFVWFRERYPQFLYVIAGTRRGAGVGRVFYGDVQSFAETRVPVLSCEVFLEELSNPALLFHGSFGFREVGQHVMPGVNRRAAMLLKELCSYPYVRQTYGDHLPDQPWLSGRSLPGRKPHRATGT
jgi:predicted GNAT superfamily acetyltransferase